MNLKVIYEHYRKLKKQKYYEENKYYPYVTIVGIFYTSFFETSSLLIKTLSVSLCFVTLYSFHLVVFMGSLKYPDENGFDAFLKKHGGSDNASTDCERTVFQFDVQRKSFKEALDR